MKTAVFCAFLIASSLASAADAIHAEVDLTDAPRKLFHAHLSIPVQPGPLTLAYAQWIPGEHAPSGPISNLAGVKFQADGADISWRRDDVNMFEFHVTIPAGVTKLDARLDFLATADPSGFSSGACTTPNLAVLNWNQVLLYPAGQPADQVMVQPAIKLLQGWQFGTALSRTGEHSGYQDFAPVPLGKLIDSPLLAGRYFKEIPLATEITPKHFLDMAADDPANLEITQDQINGFSNLVREASALFDSHHYNSYHFLLTLSDNVAHFGLEHHESSDDRADARTLVDDDFALVNADLLPHEFVHSWNGKYRRPAGLLSPTYQEPMKSELLWVYEGLTQYYGDVLASRAGLRTPEQFHAYLAETIAQANHRPGRTWRNLEDTAVSAQILYDWVRPWDNWRRSTDFYPEGELLWLDVDLTIRQLSHGTKSLDDFCRAFYTGAPGPAVNPYTLEQLVAALNSVQPNDWLPFLKSRILTKAPQIPEQLDKSGYRVVYKTEMNDYIRASDSKRGGTDAWYSLGLSINGDGSIDDVLFDSPAFDAKLGPGMKIVAVDGVRESDSTLRAAIRNSTKQPVDLIVENEDTFRVLQLNYKGPERFPELERINGSDALLDQIIKPQVSKQTT